MLNIEAEQEMRRAYETLHQGLIQNLGFYSLQESSVKCLGTFKNFLELIRICLRIAKVHELDKKSAFWQ